MHGVVRATNWYCQFGGMVHAGGGWVWTLAEEDLEHHEGVVWMQLVARVDHHLAIHHLICKRDIKPSSKFEGCG